MTGKRGLFNRLGKRIARTYRSIRWWFLERGYIEPREGEAGWVIRSRRTFRKHLHRYRELDLEYYDAMRSLHDCGDLVDFKITEDLKLLAKSK